MKPELRFETTVMRRSKLGEESSVPDLVGSLILQNDLQFELGEKEQIYEAYGKKRNSYPYRQYNTYDRVLEERETKTAVLENEYIKAVLLPELGGRLWSLFDKEKGENLLYTNDVIRFSNLAVRNAWFSGGVEWNIGIIGHTPLSTEQMYTAKLCNEQGDPVLRMYAYERIREVEYQMDFWLGEQDRYLNCRMRIVNTGSKVVPMYWWSNMAVPEYTGGRISVPAKSAYTCTTSCVHKVEIPMVDGVDVTQYEDVPNQVDYFFDIPEDSPKYITNLNASGYGLLQVSTQRLQGRKLFSWGKNLGSDRWQEFLTEDAGRYVEIQAGLGKTQYGCIPMPPHSAWEWVEQYGAIEVSAEEQRLSHEQLSEILTDKVKEELAHRRIEEVLIETEAMAKAEGELIYKGVPYGALEQLVREAEGERPLSPHLQYGDMEPRQEVWADFLRSGVLAEKNPEEKPEDFQSDEIFYKKLKETIQGENKGNWYAHYQLGVMHLYHEEKSLAEEELKESLELAENPWAYHGLAAISVLSGDKDSAKRYMSRGLAMRTEDLSYAKEAVRLLLMAEGYEQIAETYERLPEEIQKESRMLFAYMTALSFIGRSKEAYQILTEMKDYVLDDLREGEDSLGQLYGKLYESVHAKKPDSIPHEWNFNAMKASND